MKNSYELARQYGLLSVFVERIVSPFLIKTYYADSVDDFSKNRERVAVTSTWLPPGCFGRGIALVSLDQCFYKPALDNLGVIHDDQTQEFVDVSRIPVSRRIKANCSLRDVLLEIEPNRSIPARLVSFKLS